MSSLRPTPLSSKYYPIDKDAEGLTEDTLADKRRMAARPVQVTTSNRSSVYVGAGTKPTCNVSPRTIVNERSSAARADRSSAKDSSRAGRIRSGLPPPAPATEASDKERVRKSQQYLGACGVFPQVQRPDVVPSSPAPEDSKQMQESKPRSAIGFKPSLKCDNQADVYDSQPVDGRAHVPEGPQQHYEQQPFPPPVDQANVERRQNRDGHKRRHKTIHVIYHSSPYMSMYMANPFYPIRSYYYPFPY